MQRVPTTSFFPFGSRYAQGASAAAQTAEVSHSHSDGAVAVLEATEPGLDARRGQFEFSSVVCEPIVADDRPSVSEKPFQGLAAFEEVPAIAAERNPLAGTWRLVSSEATVEEEGKTEVHFTERPKGYLIVTPAGRLMTVCVGGDGERKKIPTSQADFCDLWKSMLAYTGSCRVEGDEIVTTVEISWYELWKGTQQRRRFNLEGDRLTIVTIPQRMGAGPRAKATVSCKVVWERES